MIVTRTTSKENLGSDVSGQLGASPKVLMTTGGALFALGLIPGLPKAPMMALGAVWALAGLAVSRRERPKRGGEKPTAEAEN